MNKKLFKNQSGQGLIEYLILVALIAVAAIGIVQTLQKTVNAQFTNVTNAIGGHGKSRKVSTPKTVKGDYQKRGLNDFMERANSHRDEQ